MKRLHRISHRVITLSCVILVINGLTPRQAHADEFWRQAKAYTKAVADIYIEAMSKLSDAADALAEAKVLFEAARVEVQAAEGAAVGAAAAALSEAALVLELAVGAVTIAEVAVVTAAAIATAAGVGTALGQGADYLISQVWDPILPIEVADEDYFFPTDPQLDNWIPDLISFSVGQNMTRTDFDAVDVIRPGAGTAAWEFMQAGLRSAVIATRGAGAFTAGRCEDVLDARVDLQASIPVYTTAIQAFADEFSITPTFEGDPTSAIQNLMASLNNLEMTLLMNPGECPMPGCDIGLLLFMIDQARTAADNAQQALDDIGDGAGNPIMLDGEVFEPVQVDDFLAWLDECAATGVACLPNIEVDLTDRFMALLGATYDGVPSIAPQIAEWDGFGDTGNEAALFAPDGVLLFSEVLTTAIDNHWVRIDLDYSPLVLICLGGCVTHADCADIDVNGIRDDGCVWWDCAAGVCAATNIHYADMGGEFGACVPDGTVDANDKFHALNCFSNSNTLGLPGYFCEDAPPAAFNVDAAGLDQPCIPDGVCDANDAFAALNAFSNNTTCACPADGGPLPQGPGDAVIVSTARVNLYDRPGPVRPGGLVEVDVFLADPVPDLRGYQLHLGVTGGRSGSLELIDITVNERKDHVFAGLPAWSAFNVHTGQMVAGLDSHGIETQAGAYLATWVYRVSKRAAGTHVIELQADQDDPLQRTKLFSSSPASRIDIGATAPVVVTVRPERRLRVAR